MRLVAPPSRPIGNSILVNVHLLNKTIIFSQKTQGFIQLFKNCFLNLYNCNFDIKY